MELNKIINGDCLEVLKTMPDNLVNCCITSPPYWGLRDYGVDGQLGLEPTPEEYVENMVNVFREVRRVLKGDGTLWLNIGDCYNSDFGGGSSSCGTGNKNSLEAMGRKTKPKHNILKKKDLVGIPWRVAFALQEPYFVCSCGFGGRQINCTSNIGGYYCPTCGAAMKKEDGWYLRQDIIWHKPNPMPESVTDRCTKSHEYVFLLSKSQKYYYDAEAIKEDSTDAESFKGIRPRSKDARKTGLAPQNRHNMAGKKYEKRNKRSVWTVPTKPFKKAHFATFPEKLIEPCILAGCPKDGIVLDPFIGSGTTGKVSRKYHRNFMGIDINSTYIDEIAEDRTGTVQPVLEIML